ATARPFRSVPDQVHVPAAGPRPSATRRPRASRTSKRTCPTAPDQSTRTEPCAGLGVVLSANDERVPGGGDDEVGLPTIRNASTWSTAWIHSPALSPRAK